MADAENHFLTKLAAIINTANDKFKRLGGPVALFHSFRSSFDDGRNKVNYALRKTKARSGHRHIDQQFGTALMFDKFKVRR